MFFWGYFLFLLLGYALVYKYKTVRNNFLLFMSLYFYYKCSGIFIWLLIFSIVANYYLGIGIYKCQKIRLRKFYVAISVAVCILPLLYFKYSYFFVSVWNSVFGTRYDVFNYLAFWTNKAFGSHFDLRSIILPAGISFYSFQALSYTIDLYRGKTKPVKTILEFGFYKSFFPQLIAGPIVRAAEFLPQLYSSYALTVREMGHALFLILNGLLKKMIISDYISINFVDRVYDNPLGYSGFENLMAVYGYALQIYCDFSGYTDIAIGVALLLGFRLPVNFNSPYKATSLTDFWRRWHISLSSWLRDYLYISLGGNRVGKFRTNLNLFITMLLGGLWHGANFRFAIWGGLHGFGLIVTKWIETKFLSTSPLDGYRKIGAQVLTFHFVCFAWIFFRCSDLQMVKNMLLQIGTRFNVSLIPQALVSYSHVFFIMIAGFAIHWMPGRVKERYRGWFIKTPVYAKIGIAVLAALLIFQVKSAVLQPFIYFQF
jgi:D-alanyl-lipoteichoic acid acyltransferase DltB (MBOAT superfamily)